jgi:hypothetical protein
MSEQEQTEGLLKLSLGRMSRNFAKKENGAAPSVTATNGTSAADGKQDDAVNEKAIATLTQYIEHAVTKALSQLGDERTAARNSGFTVVAPKEQKMPHEWTTVKINGLDCSNASVLKTLSAAVIDWVPGVYNCNDFTLSRAGDSTSISVSIANSNVGGSAFLTERSPNELALRAKRVALYSIMIVCVAMCVRVVQVWDCGA